VLRLKAGDSSPAVADGFVYRIGNGINFFCACDHQAPGHSNG
jgi:hypothetical protein